MAGYSAVFNLLKSLRSAGVSDVQSSQRAPAFLDQAFDFFPGRLPRQIFEDLFQALYLNAGL